MDMGGGRAALSLSLLCKGGDVVAAWWGGCVTGEDSRVSAYSSDPSPGPGQLLEDGRQHTGEGTRARKPRSLLWWVGGGGSASYTLPVAAAGSLRTRGWAVGRARLESRPSAAVGSHPGLTP